MSKVTKKSVRSAVTGRYVPKKKAKTHPRTTVTETDRVKKRKK